LRAHPADSLTILLTGSLGLVTVMLDVLLGGLGGVMRGVVQMSLGGVGVVGGQFMVAGFVVLGGFAMMASGVVVVFGCLVMMFCGLLGHESSLEFGPGLARCRLRPPWLTMRQRTVNDQTRGVEKSGEERGLAPGTESGQAEESTRQA